MLISTLLSAAFFVAVEPLPVPDPDLAPWQVPGSLVYRPEKPTPNFETDRCLCWKEVEANLVIPDLRISYRYREHYLHGFCFTVGCGFEDDVIRPGT